jgi:LysM repeat protein
VDAEFGFQVREPISDCVQAQAQLPRDVRLFLDRGGGAEHLRLTRRGRLTIFLATVAALVVLAVALGSTTVATDEPGAPVPATTVTVLPGQTLWDIAVAANPKGQDVRVTVDDIMRLNSLESAGDLQSGSRIAVPTYR